MNKQKEIENGKVSNKFLIKADENTTQCTLKMFFFCIHRTLETYFGVNMKR